MTAATFDRVADPGLRPGNARWAITALAMGSFATIAATAMPAAALPILSRELGAGPAETIWIIVLFQVGSAMTLLPAAAVVDIFGVRPVMLSGLALFTVSSIACIFCTSLTDLAIARSLQGIGSAGVMTVAGALVRQYYAPQHVGRGIGIAAFASATAGAVGPGMGTLLAAWVTWQAIFVVSAVNGAIALAIAWPVLVRTPRATRRFPLRQATATSAVMGALLVGLFGLTQNNNHPAYAALMIGGIISAVPLVRQQLAIAHPVIPVDLLLIPGLRRAYTLSVGFFCAHLMTFVMLPFLLIYRLGAPAAQIGIQIGVLSLFGALGAPLAAWLAERLPARAVATAGTALLSIGIFALAKVPAHAGWLDIAWRTATAGIGVGLFQTPNFKLIIASAPKHRSGSAGGMQATTRLVGQAIGSAMVALVLQMAGPASLVALWAAGLIAVALTAAGLAPPRERPAGKRATPPFPAPDLAP